MIDTLDLGEIRTFVLIARLGGFGKAADALGVSRSHVSRQLSALEQTLGVRLINRTTRTQQLTAAGAIFLDESEAALNRIGQAAQEAINGNQTMRGHIRINCVGGYLGENIVAPLLGQFMRHYPDITLDIDFTSHRVDLLADQFDLVFRMGAIPDCGFIAKQLSEIDMRTLASPQYLQRYGTPQHPHDLVDAPHRCIVGSVSTWHYHSTTESDMYVPVPPTLSCKNGRVMVQSAVAGLGIIRVPSVYCQAEIEQGQLIPLLCDWNIPKVPFSLLYHQDKYRPQRIRTLIDFIVQSW